MKNPTKSVFKVSGSIWSKALAMIPKDEDKELALKYKVEGECLTIFVSQSVRDTY